MPPNPYRRQPNINDMMYPKGSRQPRQVWGAVMNVYKAPPSDVVVTPTPTPSNTPTGTPNPTTTPTNTPTNTGTPTGTPSPTTTPTPTTTLTSTPTQTSTSTPTPTITPSPTRPASGTTEALIYLNRVVQSGGTVNSTASAATITLFTSLVSNNLWDKLYAFYPVLGGVAASHSINGNSGNGTLYDLGFFGGWTHTSSGMQANGTNGYAETSFNPNTTIGNGGTSHLSVYVNLQGSGNRVYDMGVATSDAALSGMLNIAAKRSSGTGNNTLFDAGDFNGGNGRVSTTSQASASGMTVGSYRSATDKTLYRNGSNIATQTANNPSAYANRTMVIAAQKSDAGVQYYNDNRYAFVTIGSGLTNTDIVNLSSIINTYETSLGRNTY
jgi:hypothetical protein